MRDRMHTVFLCLAVLRWNGVLSQEAASSPPSPTQQFPHSVVLDANQIIHLHWEHTDTHITFEVHGRTTGWVGIGFSPSGSMANADMPVGWVKNGEVFLTDRHGPTTGNSYPPLDVGQNLEILDGREMDGWTIIKFRRELATCEAGNDKEITSDTIRLIYAYGDNDPTGSDLTQADYHGTKRGSKSIVLLGQIRSAASAPVGETYNSFELLNNNFSVPAEETYYNCRLFQLPTFSSKHHLVRVEPVIQLGNEVHTHHILIYQCTRNIENSGNLGQNEQCYSPNMPPDFTSCSFVIVAWAIGGGNLTFPSHVGFPLGTDDAAKYVVMETHYDNPSRRSGIGVKQFLTAPNQKEFPTAWMKFPTSGNLNIVDSSGLRFVYTSNLRQYDASVIEVGHAVSGLEQIIPPNAQSFQQAGECTSQCLDQALQDANLQNITVFAVMLHSHLLGAHLTLKHIRNAKELPHIAEDTAYDFNFQETRYLQREVAIEKGDTLQLVCTYNSLSRTSTTVGGLDTQKEMCLSYVYYYPKISVTFCETNPLFDSLMTYFGIQSYTFTAVPNAYSTLDVVNVTSPQVLTGKTAEQVVNNVSWNESKADEFAEATSNMFKNVRCRGTGGSLSVPSLVPPLEINQRYTKSPLTCQNPSNFPTKIKVSDSSSGSATVSTTTGVRSMVIALLTVLFLPSIFSGTSL